MRADLRLLLIGVGLLVASLPAAAAQLACDQLTIYVREGCPHCADAKVFVQGLRERLPQLSVTLRDVEQDSQARADFLRLSRQHQVSRPGVPTFAFCDQVLVGFGSAETTGRRLEDLLLGQGVAVGNRTVVDLPVFGAISPGDLGLPVFTIALGLVDGFNPCAMWVLLFLLSLLVHVKNRARIALVAGIFVLVSGLVYFAFMAAWLNVFLLLGYSRWLQVALGVLAIFVGTVHVKDFFALHHGLTLSIPEAAKPGLYERVRRIVRAENLVAAVVGVTVMAVLVNFVELLCTAGLPALYTQILTYYDLSDGAYYGYLALYNLAYIFDDGLMVTIAVVTLGNRRLQEREGRWLKLLSGALILALGIAMLVAPQLLVF